MSFKFFYFSIFLFISINLVAQAPVVNVSFDDCNIIDEGSISSQLILINDAECVCGLNGESFEFDGVKDGIDFDDKLNFLFDSDFTLEFYFTLNNKFDIVDLVSFKSVCRSDSSFSIQYYPSIKELRFLGRGSEFQSVELKIPLDESQCWHHFALVRNGFNYFLYLDGQFSENINAENKYKFSKKNVLSISNNSCDYDNSSNFSRLKGRVDEFKIYNYALNSLELKDRRISSDKILNQDTTIFLGDGIDIRMGPTCAESFNWTTKQDLDDPDVLTPFITPKKSSKYYIYYLMKGKTCKDSISIFVQDKDKLKCDKLLVPNSFTPNGDGLNEVIGISNRFIVSELKFFEIYNRLGTRVFRTENKNEGWDGFYNGEKINPGKFVYKIEYVCKDKEYLNQGIINLIR